MIVAMKDEVKDYRDNYHEAFKKLVYYYRILSVVLLNCNVLAVYIGWFGFYVASMVPSIMHVRGGRIYSYLFYGGFPTFLYMVADSLM